MESDSRTPKHSTKRSAARDPRNLDADLLDAETRALRGLARSLAGNAADGEDLAQDAWVTALERPARPGWSLRGWLSGITRNHARQHRRTERRRIAREQRAAEPESVTVADALERLDLLRHLLGRVRGLDEPYRSVLLLRFVEGLETGAVAARLGVPAATVRTRIKRGLDRLRADMDDSVDGGRAAWAVPFASFGLSPGATATATAAVGAGASLASVSALGVVTTTSAGFIMKKSVAVLICAVVVLAAAVPFYFEWGGAAEDDAAPVSTVRAAARPADGGEVAPERAVGATEARPGDRVDVEADLTARGSTLATVTGRVLDREQRPLPGAEVWVTGAQSKPRSKPQLGAVERAVREAGPAPLTRTDASGRFSVELDLGSVEESPLVRVEAVTADYVRGLTFKKRVAAAGANAAPEVLEVELRLSPSLAITGFVRDPDGHPIANAEVFHWREQDRPAWTDARGAFRLDGLDPRHGEFYLRAQADGFVGQGHSAELREKGDGTTFDEVVFVLPFAARLEGRVVAAGQPVEGAVVSVAGAKFPPRAESDADGRFVLEGLQPGIAVLFARHDDFAPHQENVEVPAAGRTGQVTISLDAGRVLRGVVRSDQDRVLEGALVMAWSGRRFAGKVETDAEGRYSLSGLPAGALRLECEADRCVPLRDHEVQPDATDVDLRLATSGWLAGVVLDADTLEPVPKFQLRVLREGALAGEGVPLWASKPSKRGQHAAVLAPWTLFGDPQGRWQIDVGAAVGVVTDVEVQASGYANAVVLRQSARPAVEPESVRVLLGRGTTLRGVVTDLGGAALSGATVRVVGAAGKAQTDDGGVFEIPNLQATQLQLAIEHAECGIFAHAVSIPVGAAVWDERILVHAQGTLRGTVRAATGEPIPGAWIQLYPLELMSGKRMTRNAKAGAQGEYEFVHLPPGDYELRRMESSVGAEGKSLWSHSQIVTIEGREPVEVDLRSGGSAVVRGTIESSVPVPLLAYVRLVPVLATGLQFDTTRASRWGRAHNGRFEFEEVEPGAYELRAEFEVAERARGARGMLRIEVGSAGEYDFVLLADPQ